MKGLMRFGKKGKLALRFIGPFEILNHVRVIAYRLALPIVLANIHNVFHVSMLKKYMPDESHIISWEQVKLTNNTSYTEEPIRIMNKEQVQRTKTIPLVTVLWLHHGKEEATWEWKVEVKEKYPHLFDDTSQARMNFTIFYSSTINGAANSTVFFQLKASATRLALPGW
ncbi:uncharacterized protein LOC131244137 [Magnolia sinica]|uniref:uncharacterized protein LOC131244137 n=1 Tax=Magnolia sinica TaxID=86752 RepID=UPI0026591F11|nr:uncharacterized protein LOC131244137 [Magnolia sinica]